MSLHQQNLTKAIHGQRPKQVKKRITLKTKSSPKLCKFLLLHNKCFPLEPAAGCLLLEVCLDHIFFPCKLLQLTYTYSGLVLPRSGGKLRRGCLMLILQSQANTSFVSLQISGQPALPFLHWRRELLPSVLLTPHWGTSGGSYAVLPELNPRPQVPVVWQEVACDASSLVVMTWWHRESESLHVAARSSGIWTRLPLQPKQLFVRRQHLFLPRFFCCLQTELPRGVFPMGLSFRAPSFHVANWTVAREKNALTKDLSLGSINFICISNAP